MNRDAVQENLKRDPDTGLFIWWLQDEPQLPVDLSILSEEERARASRYRIAEKQRQFTFTRWAGRLLLARELGVSSEEVIWPARGAPEITVAGEEVPRISVSVSHTGCNSFIAIGPGHLAIGIDVEHIVQNDALSAIATAALSPQEREQLQATPSADQPLRLTTIWTMKEAVLKSVGGIDFPDWTSLQVELSSDGQRPTVGVPPPDDVPSPFETLISQEGMPSVLPRTRVIPLPLNCRGQSDLVGALAVRARNAASRSESPPAVTLPKRCDGNLFKFANYEENRIILPVRLCQADVTIFE